MPFLFSYNILIFISGRLPNYTTVTNMTTKKYGKRIVQIMMSKFGRLLSIISQNEM